MNTTKEHCAYHALTLAVAGDYLQLRAIHEQFPSWSAAWTTLSTQYSSIDTKRLAQQLDALRVRLILASDLDFPPPLREIPFPPFGIFVLGVLPHGSISIAIVGTRRATPQGLEIAKTFGADLARAGATIVSGLALGIDAAAHRGALETGRTVAVLACGLHMIYPTQHTQLAKKIVERGAIISEYPPGSPALPFRFLERNRIVSGLSRGVLIVEAPEQSGALATTRFALEQNRDVFVIPGSITHPNYVGSLNLLKSGAIPVTSPTDILNEYGVAHQAHCAAASLTPEERSICAAIAREALPVSIDKIVSLTQLEPHIVQQTLTYLILKDAVKEAGGAYELSL